MNQRHPPSPQEAALRAEVEREVVADVEKLAKANLDRDAALQAVTASVFVMVCIALPIFAAALGAAVRVFGLVSGLY
jgi:hypothetical protein